MLLSRPQRLAAPASCRNMRPSAASPIVPVTITRSPALAPPRSTMAPRGTAPKAAIATVTNPGVRSVSPPSSGQPNFLMSARRPAANFFSQRSSMSLVIARDSRKPSGLAPLAARSERLTRKAFLATASAGSSGKKCTPAITASVVSTSSCAGGTATTAASSARPSAPGWVASGPKCRAIRRSSAESWLGLRGAIACSLQCRRSIRISVRRSQLVAGSNSPARNLRASASSTAFTMPVSSRSTNALATPTYSDTTTRAGMSERLSSS